MGGRRKHYCRQYNNQTYNTLFPEIDANCRYELGVEYAVGVLVEETGFANTRIACTIKLKLDLIWLYFFSLLLG